MIDESIKAIFLEEAADIFNELEKALLTLEENPDDNAIIEQVFRELHTLKGNCNMFGYDKLGAFLHEIETVYDSVRSGELAVSKELLSVTLESLDHLKIILYDPELSDKKNKDRDKILSERILAIAGISETNEGRIARENMDKSPEKNKGETSKATTYYIVFKPDEDILLNGTNPLYLMDELSTLGKCEVFPDLGNVPDMFGIEPAKCYTNWQIFISTTQSINVLKEVFIFVEDMCLLEIHEIAQKALLSNELFLDRIRKDALADEDIDINELIKFANTLSKKTLREKIVSVADKSKGSEKNGTNGNKAEVISSIRVSSDKLDELMNLVSEMVTTQARLSLFAEQNTYPELVSISEDMQKLSRQLRDNAFNICLIPIDNMLTRFKRLVRDMSGKLNKNIAFVTEGAETELDKKIIENLVDPIMHIIRNSIDHGIEDPGSRAKLGKPEKGTILLKAFYSGANVHIEIKDDGAGIDPERIKQKAIEMGILNPESVLSEKEIFDIVFLPGFTTAAEITDISGRGVGMDVVKRKISEIRGEVEIESKVNEGTTTTIILPLTLSIIDGLLVKIDDTHLILPLSVVEKIYPVKYDLITNAFNNIIILDGEQIPFLDLRDEFGIWENCPPNVQVVIVAYEEKRMGLVIDTVIGEYQAVLKPVGYYYKNQDIISGATILGDGTVALVLDTNRIIKKFTAKTSNEELVA